MGEQEWFENPIQYNYYLANPDSKKQYPELNKDIALSNLRNTTQKIILIKGRVANYIEMIFAQCPAVDKDGNVIPAVDKNGNEKVRTDQQGNEYVEEALPYRSIAYSSFHRDLLSIAVTSQGLNHTLLSKLTEQISTVKHSYAMDKDYKKNLGG